MVIELSLRTLLLQARVSVYDIDFTEQRFLLFFPRWFGFIGEKRNRLSFMGKSETSQPIWLPKKKCRLFLCRLHYTFRIHPDAPLRTLNISIIHITRPCTPSSSSLKTRAFGIRNNASTFLCFLAAPRQWSTCWPAVNLIHPHDCRTDKKGKDDKTGTLVCFRIMTDLWRHCAVSSLQSS